MITPLARLLLAATLWLSLPALANDVAWISDAKGCKVANLSPQPGETIRWSGECRNGYAHGEGQLVWSLKGIQTEIYEGTMVNGYAEGRGTLRSRGARYVGDWKQSRQHGTGRYDDEDGSWYQGEWSEGLPHGHGKMQTRDGRLLEGDWNQGEFEEAGDMPGRT